MKVGPSSKFGVNLYRYSEADDEWSRSEFLTGAFEVRLQYSMSFQLVPDIDPAELTYADQSTAPGDATTRAHALAALAASSATIVTSSTSRAGEDAVFMPRDVPEGIDREDPLVQPGPIAVLFVSPEQFDKISAEIDNALTEADNYYHGDDDDLPDDEEEPLGVRFNSRTNAPTIDEIDGWSLHDLSTNGSSPPMSSTPTCFTTTSRQPRRN